jgi:hypothetical protein
MVGKSLDLTYLNFILLYSSLEVKVEDIQAKINDQIDMIRQECSEMWGKSPEEAKPDKFEKLMHEKEVEIIMLRKDLENLKEHNERVWRGYENDVKDLRNQLGKKHANSSDNQRNKNDELSSQLNITHTYKERSSTELQSAQEEIDRLSKKISLF